MLKPLAAGTARLNVFRLGGAGHRSDDLVDSLASQVSC
jgi:hypothetical protein